MISVHLHQTRLEHTEYHKNAIKRPEAHLVRQSLPIILGNPANNQKPRYHQ
ncbi:hypothetical protein GGQ95_002745 [Anoxybacillus rupiensis]|nr:hypothetical protein [Anoxybacillus rupiensis]